MRFRRQILCLLGFVGLLLAVRLVWEWGMQRKLAWHLEQVRARGEPATLAEITIPSVAEAENAWPAFVQAAQALNRADRLRLFSERRSATMYRQSENWRNGVAQSETTNATAFGLARSARDRPGARLRQSHADAVSLRELADVNMLGRVLADGALLLAERGEHAAALARIIDLLHLTRTLWHDPFRRTHLIAAGLDASAAGSTLFVCAGLPAEIPAETRAAMRELIKRFLDEQLVLDARAAGLLVDRCAFGDDAGQSAQVWLLRPLVLKKRIDTFEYASHALAAARCDDWPDARDRLGARRAPRAWTDRRGPYDLYLVALLPPDVFTFGANPPDALRRIFTTLAERRAAAAALALHLYRAEHGRFPATLDELVPAHLVQVPRDSLSAGHPPLMYLSSTARPLLSFSASTKDQLPPHPTFDWHGPADLRQYRDFTRP